MDLQAIYWLVPNSLISLPNVSPAVTCPKSVFLSRTSGGCRGEDLYGPARDGVFSNKRQPRLLIFIVRKDGVSAGFETLRSTSYVYCEKDTLGSSSSSNY